MSWEQRWQEGRTAWDRGASPPVLVELVQSNTLPTGRALVPGCGAGYDVLTLASEQRKVLGLDVAPTAAHRFRHLRQQLGVSADHADVLIDDFFGFDSPVRFNLIWDYTFLCAINPALREAWAERVTELLVPGGELITLLFPALDHWPPRPDEEEGPPFPLHPQNVSELLQGRFVPTVLEPVERSHPDRQGREWLGRWKRR